MNMHFDSAKSTVGTIGLRLARKICYFKKHVNSAAPTMLALFSLKAEGLVCENFAGATTHWIATPALGDKALLVTTRYL
jgi:hypothetical protein